MPAKKQAVPPEGNEPEASTPPSVADVQNAVAQSLQSYFTESVNQAIRDCTDDEMHNMMRQLESSEYWIPMLKYISARLFVAQGVVNQTDPIRDAATILRTQGHMQGLTDIQNYVIQLVMIERQAQTDAAEIRSEFL